MIVGIPEGDRNSFLVLVTVYINSEVQQKRG